MSFIVTFDTRRLQKTARLINLAVSVKIIVLVTYIYIFIYSAKKWTLLDCEKATEKAVRKQHGKFVFL